MKRLFCCILAFVLCLSVGGCGEKATSNEAGNPFIKNVSNKENIAEYQYAEFDKFNSPAEENGLEGTKVYMSGIVDKAINEEGIIFVFLTSDEGKPWLLSVGIEEQIDFSYIETLTNQKVLVFADYMGFSEVYKCPAVMLNKAVNLETGEIYSMTEFLGADNYVTLVQKIGQLISANMEQSEAEQNAVEQAPEKPKAAQKWQEGQYKCGVDIEPGIYMVFTTGGHTGYYSVTADSNGEKIIANDNFENNQILEIAQGQYLELARAYAVKYEEAPLLSPEDGILPEGRYRVGQHIQAGEYKIRATSSSKGYYSLTSDPNGGKILSNDNFDGERYITIKEGQYLQLTRCELVVAQ